METSSLSLKSAIDNLFAHHDLSLMKVRGQSYDGASNMKGEFNGLKTLIMNENESAYYVHCFAHQLQLALVAVARKHVDIADFFNIISTLMNVMGASCKRKDMIRQKQAKKVAKGIKSGLIETGKGLNQELSLKRAGDTRWGSHYRSLLNLAALFSYVVEVLEVVSCDATDSSKKVQARGLLRYLQSFGFVFNL
ncbi:zinc finger MYM-type protein 1-like [Iris pallida]|uniref:Zinc finger MYM-type protein 1-like n=1 Tax=Iris pallida TaxID=29817 RepID=A0AAX6DUE5_IRIPA|nr:zinc finger MYM-type protein 1-like [Iris pallida]